MLNVHDLERRWLKYKIKSYLPMVLTASAILITTILLVVFLPKTQNNIEQVIVSVKKENINMIENKKDEEIIEEKKRSIEPIEENVKLNPLSTNEETVENSQEKQTLILKPSLHFMDNIEDSISPYFENKEETPVIENRSANVDYSTKKELAKESVKIEEPEQKKLQLSVRTQDDRKEDLEDVIRRFKKNKNPTLSLFIAKHYYADGNYQKSYNYALMTNEIDSTIEESWLIFSKSLVKLGQKDLAINTLTSYLKSTKSTSADVLLRKIKEGSFK